MKVLIADDHKIVRDGLRTLLSDEPDIEICAEASSGRETVEQISTSAPDLLLLDLRMPGTSGFEVLKAIQDLEQRPRVLVLTMHDDLTYVRRAIQLGADGYLVKSVGRDELLKALRSVHAGRPFMQDELTRALVVSIGSDGAPASPATLSDRQRQVLEALAEGLDNREIAAGLWMSESAVKVELRALYSALGVARRSEAVAIGFRLGILT